MMGINSLRIVGYLVIERKQNRIITVITHKGGGGIGSSGENGRERRRNINLWSIKNTLKSGGDV